MDKKRPKMATNESYGVVRIANNREGMRREEDL